MPLHHPILSSTGPRGLKLSLFVAREELRALAEYFRDRSVPGVFLTGRSGSGKSTMAQAFINEAADLFPGGIDAIDGQLGRDSDLERWLQGEPSKPSLLVVDEFPSLTAKRQVDVLTKATRNEFRQVLLVAQLIDFDYSRIDLTRNFRTLELRELTRSEFFELARRMAVESNSHPLSIAELDRIYELSQGHPLYAYNILRAGRAEGGAIIEGLTSYLRNFYTPGILGPDGSPISRSGTDKIIVEIKSTNDELLKRLKNDPELIRNLSPRQFEEIVADLLQDMGYHVELTPASRDGGLDMYAARKDGLGKFLYLVECKRFIPPTKVQVGIVRSLYGVLNEKRANAGAIVTTSFFTSGAMEFQKKIEHQMKLHDYVELQRWISDFPLRNIERDKS